MPLSRLPLFGALLWLAIPSAPASEPRWRELNRIAREALESQDYGKLRDALIELRPLMPGNARIDYLLATAESKLGNRDAALKAIAHLAGMGLVFDLAADAAFESLRDSREFRSLLERVERNRQPVGNAQLTFPLAERDLIPEDIAYDPKTRRFFISSARRGRILTADGKAFAHGVWPILAVRADPPHRVLWASTGYLPQCETCPGNDQDKTALLAYDLDSGVLKQRIDSPVPGLLGDMTVSRHGDVFVSEGTHGGVFHLPFGARELRRLDEPGEFPAPQTPALSPDERILYVPDYLRGIAAMDLKSRKVEWLHPAEDIALSGIDGLYLVGDSLLAIQNGTTPKRLVRFSRDLRRQEVLEANTPGLGEPTHGVIVGHEFYFLANTGWDTWDAKGRKKEGAQAVESTVRRLKLHR